MLHDLRTKHLQEWRYFYKNKPKQKKSKNKYKATNERKKKPSTTQNSTKIKRPYSITAKCHHKTKKVKQIAISAPAHTMRALIQLAFFSSLTNVWLCFQRIFIWLWWLFMRTPVLVFCTMHQEEVLDVLMWAEFLPWSQCTYLVP